MPAASAVIKKVYPPTRQFLGRLNNPKVEYIKGISAAIAIEQKAHTTNARSTIVTSTEIYDYIKLLFAIIGQTYSPVSEREVKKIRLLMLSLK
jgi:excinuclease ABC subunit A